MRILAGQANLRAWMAGATRRGLLLREGDGLDYPVTTPTYGAGDGSGVGDLNGITDGYGSGDGQTVGTEHAWNNGTVVFIGDGYGDSVGGGEHARSMISGMDWFGNE